LVANWYFHYMNYSLGQVLRHLASNEIIEAISLEELQKLADESPYFPVAQFLLAKKLKAENSIGFLSQAQKTALYYSNPYWLHYQLTNESGESKLSENNNFVDKEITDNTDVTAEFSGKEEAQEITIPHTPNKPESYTVILPVSKEHQGDRANEEEADAAEQTFDNRDAELAAGDKEKANQPEEEMAAIIPEPDKKTDLFLSELDNSGQQSLYNNNEEVLQEVHAPLEQESAIEVLEEMAGVSRETEEATEAFLNEAQTSAEEHAELSSPKTETSRAQADPVPFGADIIEENKKEKNGEPDEHERMFQNIKAMLDATSEEADADTENTVIPIDPYYTVDYFASQGIKLEIEQNPQDQLGQHLKKFTQWLKHMKKLGPEDATEVIARSETEADIQKFADSSNTVREVVTEAMASVLEKQGKKDKAIELYKKLSFISPDKSAYFAGKIKNLKGI